jgi:hypothetical protein
MKIALFQVKLIEHLQCLGAEMPEDDHGNPSCEMFKNYNTAIVYIHQWKHLLPVTEEQKPQSA